MMQTLYFLRQTLLASGPFPYPWDDTRPVSANIVFICPTCGEPWGRVVRGERSWLPLVRPCEKHTLPFTPGGSFLHSWLRGISWAPDALINYEFHLALRGYKDGNDR